MLSGGEFDSYENERLLRYKEIVDEEWVNSKIVRFYKEGISLSRGVLFKIEKGQGVFEIEEGFNQDFLDLSALDELLKIAVMAEKVRYFSVQQSPDCKGEIEEKMEAFEDILQSRLSVLLYDGEASSSPAELVHSQQSIVDNVRYSSSLPVGKTKDGRIGYFRDYKQAYARQVFRDEFFGKLAGEFEDREIQPNPLVIKVLKKALSFPHYSEAVLKNKFMRFQRAGFIGEKACELFLSLDEKGKALKLIEYLGIKEFYEMIQLETHLMEKEKIEESDIINLLGRGYTLKYLKELALKKQKPLNWLIIYLRDKTSRRRMAEFEHGKFDQPFKQGVVSIQSFANAKGLVRERAVFRYLQMTFYLSMQDCRYIRELRNGGVKCECWWNKIVFKAGGKKPHLWIFPIDEDGWLLDLTGRERLLNVLRKQPICLGISKHMPNWQINKRARRERRLKYRIKALKSGASNRKRSSAKDQLKRVLGELYALKPELRNNLPAAAGYIASVLKDKSIADYLKGRPKDKEIRKMLIAAFSKPLKMRIEQAEQSLFETALSFIKTTFTLKDLTMSSLAEKLGVTRQTLWNNKEIYLHIRQEMELRKKVICEHRFITKADPYETLACLRRVIAFHGRVPRLGELVKDIRAKDARGSEKKTKRSLSRIIKCLKEINCGADGIIMDFVRQQAFANIYARYRLGFEGRDIQKVSDRLNVLAISLIRLFYFQDELRRQLVKELFLLAKIYPSLKSGRSIEDICGLGLSPTIYTYGSGVFPMLFNKSYQDMLSSREQYLGLLSENDKKEMQETIEKNQGTKGSRVISGGQWGIMPDSLFDSDESAETFYIEAKKPSSSPVSLPIFSICSRRSVLPGVFSLSAISHHPSADSAASPVNYVDSDDSDGEDIDLSGSSPMKINSQVQLVIATPTKKEKELLHKFSHNGKAQPTSSSLITKSTRSSSPLEESAFASLTREDNSGLREIYSFFKRVKKSLGVMIGMFWKELRLIS